MNESRVFFDDLKQFIVENKIIGTSAGFCIAIAAKEAIQSLVDDVFIPLLVNALQSLNITFLTKYLPVTDKTQFNLTMFVKQVVTFVVVVVISFLFVQFAFGYLIGVGYATNTSK
jgi:large-conductance mechanosensitive channel